MPLSLESHFCGKVFIFECNGRIEAGPDVDALEAALAMAAHEFRTIVLNMRDVTRLDSTGLGLIVRYAAKLRKNGGDLRLAEAQPTLVSLLELTKLTSVLQNCATEEEAILAFLQHTPEPAQKKTGPRVLFIDPSADLCMFVRTLLTQHGFDVQSTSLVRDARILLHVQTVDYILAGPGSEQLSPAVVLKSLGVLAPNATALHLDESFRDRDAHDASEKLLQLLGAASVR
jgi:anti-anti-sigma factor